MSKLLDKIRATSTVKETSILSKSDLFNEKSTTLTSLPVLNIAFSGRVDKGFQSGFTMVAGESKTFKTNLSLFCVAAYLKQYDDAVCLYYDTEFGSPPPYLTSMGIDIDRVVHTPIMHLEQLKFDITKQLENISRGDHVIIFIDSIGNIASKKEVDDAAEGKSVADMTRAKQMKSMFRMVTPQLTVKDIPLVAINHTYKSQGMYPVDIISGGTGAMYSCDTAFIISRSQEKTGTELSGYKFTINIAKSRFIREKSKLPFTADFENGIDRWSGLLDIALMTGNVTKPKNGWYTRVMADEDGVVIEDKNWRAKDTSCADFWIQLFKNSDFLEQVKARYTIALASNVFEEDPVEHEIDADSE